jgi:hypothetical protein
MYRMIYDTLMWKHEGKDSIEKNGHSLYKQPSQAKLYP